MENNNKRTWIMWICIAIIVIVVIWAAFAGGCARKQNGNASSQAVSDSQGGMMDSQNGSPQQEVTSEETMAQSGEESHESMNEMLNGDTALDKYLTEQEAIMMSMMEDMVISENTGNASLSFLKGMIPHHESAIAMSEAYLKYGGESKQLEAMAKDIIKAQQEEIKQMNALVKQYEENGESNAEKETEYLKKYNEMLKSHATHHVDPETTKSIDQAFAEGMIAHHQMAVEMSRDILEFTDHDEIRQLAQSIIDAQEKEIEEMQNLLQ